MKKIILTAGFASLASLSGLHAEESKTLADFETKATSLQWQTVNDGVMGGRSQGGSLLDESGKLTFKGTISLENNGGFSSIRSFGEKHDLSEFAGIELKLKGDGRMYYLTLRDEKSRRIAYWSPIQPEKGKWVTLKVPFSSFYATSFGRKIPGIKVKLEAVRSLGFMLYDKQAGPFELQVDSIMVYPKES